METTPPRPSRLSRVTSPFRAILRSMIEHWPVTMLATSCLWLPAVLVTSWGIASKIIILLTPDNLYVGTERQDVHTAYWFASNSMYPASWGLAIGVIGLIVSVVMIIGFWVIKLKQREKHEKWR